MSGVTFHIFLDVRDWPRRPNPDGGINKNQTAEKKPDGRTEWPNLTRRPNIYCVGTVF